MRRFVSGRKNVALQRYILLKSCTVTAILALFTFTFSSRAEEGKWTVENVTFTGNDSISDEALVERMQMHPSGFLDKVTFSFSALVDDISALEAFYRRKGYIDVNIHIGAIDRDMSENEVSILLDIDEGPLITVDSIIFKGIDVLSPEELKQAINLKTGSPFDSSAYASASTEIKNALASKGYMFAEVSRSFSLDTIAEKVTISYEIKEGPLVYAGSIEYQGLDKVSEKVIKRELQFIENTKVTSEIIRKSILQIYRTGLFDYVRIEPVDTNVILQDIDTDTAPILVLVQESDMFQISAGGGYETDDGLYVSLEVMYRNLFALGHRIALDGQISLNNTGAQLSYDYPWFLTWPLNADFMSYIERRNEESFQGVFYGGLAGLSGRVGERNTYRVWTQLERVTWIDEPPFDTVIPQLPTRNTILIGSGFTRNTRVNLFRPGTAMYLSVNAELAGLGFSWSNHFYKTVLDIRSYRGFLNEKLNLSSAVYSGYVNGYGIDKESVPVQELFRSGEDAVRPVRGYSQQEITPTVNGEVVGGGFALILNVVEFRFPIYRWLGGAVFVDAGKIWSTIDEVSLDELRWSVGPGLRLTLPFILARVDYGIKIDHDWDLDGRFHVSIGLPF